MNTKDTLRKQIDELQKEATEKFVKIQDITTQLNRILAIELAESLKGTTWEIGSLEKGRVSLTGDDLGYDEATDAITGNHCDVYFSEIVGGNLTISFADGEWYLRGDMDVVKKFFNDYGMHMSASNIENRLHNLEKDVDYLVTLLEEIEELENLEVN